MWKSNSLKPAFIRLWLLALMGILTYLSVHGTNAYHYIADEVLHISMAKGRNLHEVLRFSFYETHPPLAQILRHYWLMIADSPAYVRSLSLLFGVLLIPLYYRIGLALSGSPAGLYAATLITFGHDIIIQTFVVRNYTILVFCCSLSFYYYLRWQQTRTFSMLCAYTLSAAVTCLVHFSGIFPVFCIAAYQLTRMYIHKAPKMQKIAWCSVNLLVAALWGIVYILWHPTIALWQTEVAPYLSAPWWYNVFYPPAALESVLPFCRAPACLIVLHVVLPCLVLYAAWHNKALRPWLCLTALALMIGMFCLPDAGRHSLWIAPFVIPVTGWALADVSALFSHNRWIRCIPFSPYVLMAISIAGLGWLAYVPQERFSNAAEYGLQESEWQALTQYLQTLDPHTVVIASREENFLVNPINPYSYIDTTSYNNSSVVVMPLYNTHVVFDGLHHLLFEPAMLLRLITQAQAKGVLDGSDTLVLWLTPPLYKLVHCDALKKTIPEFLPQGSKRSITNDATSRAPVLMMIVSKAVFFEDVMSPDGKARSCFL